MSEEEARKRQIEAARATREYAPVMAQEITVSEHTAGPWEYHDEGHYIDAILAGKRVQLAAMFTSRFATSDRHAHLNTVLHDQTPANGKLMAAAPALLAALGRCAKELAHHHETDNPCQLCLTLSEEACEAIKEVT